MNRSPRCSKPVAFACAVDFSLSPCSSSLCSRKVQLLYNSFWSSMLHSCRRSKQMCPLPMLGNLQSGVQRQQEKLPSKPCLPLQGEEVCHLPFIFLFSLLHPSHRQWSCGTVMRTCCECKDHFLGLCKPSKSRNSAEVTCYRQNIQNGITHPSFQWI